MPIRRRPSLVILLSLSRSCGKNRVFVWNARGAYSGLLPTAISSRSNSSSR
jgi:hypothetical protein